MQIQQMQTPPPNIPTNQPVSDQHEQNYVTLTVMNVQPDAKHQNGEPAPNIACRYDPNANIIKLDQDFMLQDGTPAKKLRITRENYHTDTLSHRIWVLSAMDRRRIQLRNIQDTAVANPNLEADPSFLQPQQQNLPIEPHQVQVAPQPQQSVAAVPDMQPNPVAPVAPPPLPPPPNVPPLPEPEPEKHYDEKSLSNVVIISSQEQIIDLFFAIMEKHVPEDDKDWKIIERMYNGHKELCDGWK